jgi:hypothetical protein
MSGQHLIGLLAIDGLPPDLRADVVPCGAIAAAVRSAPAGASGRDRLDHHAAVVAWCRRAAFLPSRAGIPISPKLLQSVARSAWFYRSTLEHIDGRVEISVELDRRNGARGSEAASSGRAYLHAAALDLGACEVGLATAASLLTMFAERADADVIARTAPLPAVRLRAAVLVKRAIAPRLAEQLDTTLNAISARLVCRVTGPWPPYSFSTIGDPP